MTTYVYLVWAEGTSHYKIGRARNPQKRLKGLQTGHSRSLQMLAYMPCARASKVEAELHQRYKEFRGKGEWFDFHPFMIPEVLGQFDVIDSWTKSRTEALFTKGMEVFAESFQQGYKESELIAAQIGITEA